MDQINQRSKCNYNVYSHGPCSYCAYGTRTTVVGYQLLFVTKLNANVKAKTVKLIISLITLHLPLLSLAAIRYLSIDFHQWHLYSFSC